MSNGIEIRFEPYYMPIIRRGGSVRVTMRACMSVWVLWAPYGLSRATYGLLQFRPLRVPYGHHTEIQNTFVSHTGPGLYDSLK